MGNLPSPPDELHEVIVWKNLGLKLANTPKELDKVGSRYVDDWLILEAGIADAREWQELNPKK